MADCFEKYYYNINDFALNPTVDKTYSVLQAILGDLVAATNTSTLHIGGDEVVYGCWAEDESIVLFMQQNGIASYDALLGYFIEKAQSIVSSFGAKPIHWEEVYNAWVKAPFTLSDDTIFQVWHDESLITKIANDNYSVIASPSKVWYLDHTDNTWQKMYAFDPAVNLTSSANIGYLLGGEAVMFGEHIDDTNLQSVVFPRAAAVGERLWSPQNVTDIDDALARLLDMRCRMVQRGFSAMPIEPGFCAVHYV